MNQKWPNWPKMRLLKFYETLMLTILRKVTLASRFKIDLNDFFRKNLVLFWAKRIKIRPKLDFCMLSKVNAYNFFDFFHEVTAA